MAGQWSLVTMDSYTIAPEMAGRRLEQAVARLQPGLWRAHGQQLIAAGWVRVNGAEAKASARLKTGDMVTVELPPPVPVETRPEQIPLTVVYEDADLLVIAK